MKTLQTEVPDRLYKQAVKLVKEGWFRTEDEIVYEALRRFIESHRMGLMEKFIREDVEWGLRGNE